MHDVFISHASEDKQQVVVPLAQALSDYGLRVWFDSSSLTIGDSPGQSHEASLSHST